MANFIIIILVIAGLLFTNYPDRLRKALLSLVGLNLFLLCLYHIANSFSRAGINEAVFAHLHHLVRVDTLIRFWPMIIIFIVSLAGIIAIVIGLNRATQSKTLKTSNSFRRLATLLVPVFALVSLGTSPATIDIALVYHQRSLANQYPYPKEFDNIQDLAPQIRYRSPKKKSNFIIIFAESLERSFFSQTEYPGLTPNLQKLIKGGGVEVQGIKQITLSNWTDAGLSAALCGVSMAANYSDFGLEENKKTPEVIKRTKSTNIIGETCIGDILAKDGYKMTFVGGSEFGIKEKEFHMKSQGFQSVLSTKDILGSHKQALPTSTWGAYDDALFLFSEQKIREEKNRLFGMVILTVDTHTPGYLAPDCDGKLYMEGQNQLLNSVHCSDKLISEFISRISIDPQYKDTTIILASDHLYPGSLPNNSKHENDRENLFVVFNSRLNTENTHQIITRTATTLDSGPTILAHLGYDIATLNFGRNLMRPAPTLIESMGHNTLSNHIVKIRHKMVNFWKKNNKTIQE